MAITQTPRLLLQKQSFSDPAWHTALNAGLDNADARLLKISSDNSNQPDPNTFVTGDYLGQLYVDETSTPYRVWVYTGGTTVWMLLNATSVEAAAAINGNTVLETILIDLNARLVAEVALQKPFPPKYKEGFTVSRVDANTLSFTKGAVRDQDDTVNIESAGTWTKTISTFVAGTGFGALAATLAEPTGWCHVFAMWGAGPGFDIGFDTDVAAATLAAQHPTYTAFRRIFSFDNTGLSIQPFNAFPGGYVGWATVRNSRAGSMARATPENVAVHSPLGIVCEVVLSLNMRSTTGNLLCNVYEVNGDDTEPSTLAGVPHGYCNVNSARDSAVARIRTTTARLVRAQAGGSIADEFYIETIGYTDYFGKEG